MTKNHKNPFISAITAMPLKAKIKAAITILMCLTIVVLTAVVNIQSHTIHQQKDELIRLTQPDLPSPPTDPVSEIDTKLIVGELKSAAELSTAELSYTGIVHYVDGSVPLLTKKAFYIIYCAEIKAGLDFEKIGDESIVVTDETVTVILPKIEIFEPDILEDSIIFVDEKKAMFNPDSKEDALAAIQEAKKDLNLNLDARSLMKKAAIEAETFIEVFLRPLIANRTLDIKFS